MAKAFIVWNGMTEYREQLRQLPATCTVEAAHIIEGEVNAAFVTISAEYGRHRISGELQDKLSIQPLTIRGVATTGKVLKSGSRLAWLFDNGSAARHYITKRGRTHATGAMWGRSAPTHVFARTVGQAKRAVVEQIRAMLLRQGATTVTTDTP